MRHRHRGVFAIVSVVVLVIVVSLIGWRTWAMYLPDPAHADGPALMRWLVLKEMADEPWRQQVVVVDRLAEALHEGISSSTDAASLSEPRRERLLRNLELSKRIWFETCVDRYDCCPAAERWDFVDVQVETVLLWANLSVSGTAADQTADTQTGETARPRHAATLRFFNELEGWIAEAKPERAAVMRRAVQAGLTCWLATRDLAVQPLATRGEIARRIVAQLDSGLQLNQVAGDLNDTRQETLKANGLLLMEVWLHGEAEQYASLPADERTSYVDARLDQIERWGLIEFLSTPDGQRVPGDDGAGVVALMTQVNTWIARAEPDRQPQLRALVGHLQQRILWRSFQSLLN